MDKIKVAKVGVKLALGFAVSAMIGYAIKAQKLAEEKIDAYGNTEEIEATPEIPAEV